MSDDLDKSLMAVVNVMGVVVFSLIVVFHFLTATPRDAEAQ